MAKFTGGAVPLIVRLHDISTHSGLLHHINISYTGTQSHTVQAVGAQMQFMSCKATIYGQICVVSGPVSLISYQRMLENTAYLRCITSD